MTLTEIKKELYKQSPIAYLRYIRKDAIYYYANLDKQHILVEFEIPISDIQDASFLSVMSASLLNRWIVKPLEE